MLLVALKHQSIGMYCCHTEEERPDKNNENPRYDVERLAGTIALSPAAVGYRGQGSKLFNNGMLEGGGAHNGASRVLPALPAFTAVCWKLFTHPSIQSFSSPEPRQKEEKKETEKDPQEALRGTLRACRNTSSGETPMTPGLCFKRRIV